ncbi:hypothetical protein TNCT_123451 [Trichonephila clavata]|uniref:Uncharacterized protein n=1 Tax=Trichonephila clavata TaxID=2740835 RepID=A0A8X6HHH1_TRICU|nr:hypothetical protein TNCT_123451 [Trichonephila clavata]
MTNRWIPANATNYWKRLCASKVFARPPELRTQIKPGYAIAKHRKDVEDMNELMEPFDGGQIVVPDGDCPYMQVSFLLTEMPSTEYSTPQYIFFNDTTPFEMSILSHELSDAFED